MASSSDSRKSSTGKSQSKATRKSGAKSGASKGATKTAGKSAAKAGSKSATRAAPKKAGASRQTPKKGAAASAAKRPWLKRYPEGIDWTKKIKPGALHDLMDHAVNAYSALPCTRFFGKQLSYREIGDLIGRAAKGLEEMGVGKDTKVGLMLPNTHYYPVLFFAVLRIGGTVVNYNPLYAEKELIYQIEDSETDIMVTMDLELLFNKTEKVFHETRLKKVIACSMTEALPGLKGFLFKLLKGKNLASMRGKDFVTLFSDLVDNDGVHQTVDVDPEEDVAVLQYTGGTTGVPKGAMLTHGNLTANVLQIEEWFNYREPGTDKLLAILPFFHVFGLTAIMLYGLYRGCELIVVPRFDPEEVLKLIDKEKPTIFAGVPTMYMAILNHPKVKDYDLSSLVYCSSGGAPLPVETLRAFRNLTGLTICEGYGLTESSPVATANPENGVQKPGSIGLPYPGTTIKIVDIDDPKKEMPQGERGEIAIMGPQVMKGYWKRPDETKETIVDGMLLTGDVGYMDEEGYVFIVDRKKEMIIASGYNVYPRNVEEAIYEHPAVDECAVVGVPDEYRGQTVKAYIKLKEGSNLTEEKLEEFLESRISKIEMPKIVEFRTEGLPKSAVGKILKKELLEAEGHKLGETG